MPRPRVNGTPVPITPERGYLKLHRTWAAGDTVTLTLPMPAERLYAHPDVRQDVGRVALRRGPLVYCLEQHDNPAPLPHTRLPADAALTDAWSDMLGGITILQATAHSTNAATWGPALYRNHRARRNAHTHPRRPLLHLVQPWPQPHASLAARMIEHLETPAVLIDLDIVEANIAAAQAQFDAMGVKFRPHIKTHKIPRLARLQLREGAQGIAAQKLSEVEVFVAEGFEDILLCFNLLSPAKIARLRALTDRCTITVVADNLETVQALSQGFADAAQKLAVLVECDTGMGRCGVQTPQAAADLARAIQAAPGLRFQGLMTYPPIAGEAQVETFMSAARALCIAAVGHCDTISSGGTPTMADAALAPSVTEYRAGTYIYNDRSLVARGACTWADCALTVLTTVTSRPTATRAILDAGSKSLTSDLLGLTGYGHIIGHPEADITGLSEEHAMVHLPAELPGPAVGQKVQVIPNHACPVSNLVGQVWFHRSGTLIGPVDVAARGCVT